MEILLTTTNILFALTTIGVIFSIYKSYRNPQIRTDQTTIRIQDEIKAIKAEVSEIKEKHLVTVEESIKELSKTIYDLSMTVTRLSTIIDERIPRGH